MERIIRANGGERVEDVVDAIGVGRRQLERLFRLQVGVGPKEFASLARFTWLIDQLGRQKSWADLALDAGYSDQAHFIRNFRRRTGATPVEFGRGGGSS
jgi:methylphosphotriester-DNA--protein-cysteine methyltransferase